MHRLGPVHRLRACGLRRKGEETVSSAAPESASSAAAASNAVEIPFVVVPELTVRYVDMVQVVNVQEGSTLNVREGPGTDYASIGKANPRGKLRISGRRGRLAQDPLRRSDRLRFARLQRRRLRARLVNARPRGQPAPKRAGWPLLLFSRLPQGGGQKRKDEI